MSMGFRVFSEPDARVAASVVAEFRAEELPVANVADAIWRFGVLCGGIQPVAAGSRYLAGTALTVRTRPTDNLMIHKAMELAHPGDVIVVEAGGAGHHALLGELMCQYAARREIAGFVVDGPVRDGMEITDLGLPVYARGRTPRGPYKDGPGEINVPISCGGVAVLPGDLILADVEGVIAIPRGDAESVLDQSLQVRDAEAGFREQIAVDGWDRAWIDTKLDEKGCEIVR
ncbi:MAG: RraA family protein [Pseudonocardiaceae bacterium]|nr:RraA family protein [Pseudonocardiaceae bacterium]